MDISGAVVEEDLARFHGHICLLINLNNLPWWRDVKGALPLLASHAWFFIVLITTLLLLLPPSSRLGNFAKIEYLNLKILKIILAFLRANYLNLLLVL